MRDSLANLIRSFGMSGFLVTEELKTLEQRYDVELGHTTRAYAEDQPITIRNLSIAFALKRLTCLATMSCSTV